MNIQPQEETTRTYSYPRLSIEIEWAGDSGTQYIFSVTVTSRTGKLKQLVDGGHVWIFGEDNPAVAPPPAFNYTLTAGRLLEDLVRTKNLPIEEYVQDKMRHQKAFTKEQLEMERKVADDMYAVSAALSMEGLEEIYVGLRELWGREVPRQYCPPPGVQDPEEVIRRRMDPAGKSPYVPPPSEPRKKPSWRKR